MTVSIIIVNYNVYELLINCINSIYANIKDIDYEIIVADNNSAERNIDSIQQIYPDVKYIRLKENIGFAKANNLAAKNANGKYLLFLNPDTLVIGNFLPEFLNKFKINKNTGICAPQLVYSDNSYQSSAGPELGLFYDILESFFLIGIYRKFTKRKYLSDLSVEHKVGWVSAACLIIERDIFNKVGGFTESYFLNYEDIDLCFKVRKLGMDVLYLPSYKCVHLDHKSFSADYESLVFTRYKSRLNYIRLNYKLLKRILSRVIFIAGLLLKIILINFSYKSNERKSRRNGYIKSLKLYSGLL